MKDLRFDTPIFTIAETHRHLAIPASTVARWMTTEVAGRPLVRRLVQASPQAPSAPFVAIVEAFVLRLLRDLGMSLEDICTAVRTVRSAFGSEYALASRKITTDGADVIVDVSRASNVREWVRARDDQRAFREVIEPYLLNIEFGADPRFGLGQPVLAQQKVRAQDLVDAWWGGDRIEDIAREYRIPHRRGGVGDPRSHQAGRLASWSIAVCRPIWWRAPAESSDGPRSLLSTSMEPQGRKKLRARRGSTMRVAMVSWCSPRTNASPARRPSAPLS